MSGKVNQNKTDKNDKSSDSEQQFGRTESTTSVQDKAWQNQRNEEEEKAESITSYKTVLKNGEDSSFSQLGIADTSNNHIYDSKKDEKDKQKATTSGSSNKWGTKSFSTYKPYSSTGLSSNPKSFVTIKPFQGSFSFPSIRTSTLKNSRQNDLLDFSSNNLQDNEEPEEQTPINEAEQNKIMLQFFQQAQKFYAKGVEPRESRLVDFPVFKGGNQDSVEWIEAFRTALTWYNRQNITFWENDNNPQRSFTHLFKDHFCNPFRISQWKHQLRNRKQKQDETIEEYIAAITELWKRVDPTDRRMELDKIHEFIEGLRPEFVVPVQSAMPQTVEEAMEKAQALETAFSMGMDLSVYSMMPGYLQNMNGGMISARTNLAMYQPAYSMSYSQPESVEKMVERKISEGITAALSQMRIETKPTNPTSSNNNNNNQNRNNSGCYVCGRTGYITKNCRQRNNQQNNNNCNNNGRDLRNVNCYNCGRKGHGESANFRKPSNEISNKRVNWKDPLEEIKPIEKPIQLLKRSTYVLNILYNNFEIYLSKRLQKNKMIYNLWQVVGGKVENRESSLQAVLRETKEETVLDIKKDECVFLFNDPAFNCDVYLTKVPDYQELQRTEPEKQGA
ncbi:hypothetical protein GLOIN_2v1772369 [Rhizophagus irregularis DAOM 181602=DAOM 197198]|nr:hypothetical protein GLOIN_2v1772369 [Rhizophagus irregularis DAOM 181602=DAOM 197198]